MKKTASWFSIGLVNAAKRGLSVLKRYATHSSHWVYFWVLAVMHALMVALIYPVSLWHAVNGEIIQAAKEQLVIGVIAVMTFALYQFFKLSDRFHDWIMTKT